MSTMPPGTPPPNTPPPGPPPGYDPRDQRRWYRDQARAQRAAWKAQNMHWRWQMRGMRRGSVLGPLLLIGAGIVFLLIQTGRIDRHDFFASYARWWPLLLVAAGVIVLAEWAFDQFQMRDPERPQYRRSIGGGVVLLLLLFAFAGGIADIRDSFLNGSDGWFVHDFRNDGDSWARLFGDKHEYDQMLDLAAPMDGMLTIVNPRGDVTVAGTSEDGRIHIAEHKTIYASSDSDAESHAQEMAPKSETNGSGTRVSVHGLDGAHADLTVTLPANSGITVNVDRGDIHVSSIKDAVNATTNHGSVELDAITGPAAVDINSGGGSLTAHSLNNGLTFRGRAGDVTLSEITGAVNLNGDIFGTTHIEHVNGSVHFHTSRSDLQFARVDGEVGLSGSSISAEQAQGPVVVSTTNRNITLERIAGDISVTNRNGTVDVTAAPALGNVTIENRNGSVNATLPEHASFAVQAATTNGKIDTNLSFSSTNNLPNLGYDEGDGRNSRNERTLSGLVGSAVDAPTIHIRTGNGDISIMKADVQPLTPPASPAKITMAPAEPAPAKSPHPQKPHTGAAAPAASAAPAAPTP
jgi:DUF4097 and DUF4098 domain-containing protein YvlB